jgi:hypothetical protein
MNENAPDGEQFARRPVFCLSIGFLREIESGAENG